MEVVPFFSSPLSVIFAKSSAWFLGEEDAKLPQFHGTVQEQVDVQFLRKDGRSQR